MTEFFSILAPSKTTLLKPITTFSSVVQEYKVLNPYKFVYLPKWTIAYYPVGKQPAVWITEFSPIEHH